jgi:hypothetical protein
MLLLCYSVRYVVDEKALHLQYVEDQHNTREGNMWVAACLGYINEEMESIKYLSNDIMTMIRSTLVQVEVPAP